MALPCPHHRSSSSNCKEECRMRDVWQDFVDKDTADSYTAVRRIFGESGSLTRFFSRVPQDQRKDVARGLWITTTMWQLNPIGGPQMVFNNLQREVDILEGLVSGHSVREPPEMTFVPDVNIHVPFVEEGCRPRKGVFCHYHDFLKVKCDGCILFEIFPPCSDRAAFLSIYNRYGKRGCIPSFFTHADALADRRTIGEAVAWDAKEWIAHPNGGPLLSFRALLARRDVLRKLLAGNMVPVGGVGRDKMQTHSSASTASNPPPMMNEKAFVPMLMPETLPPSPVRAPSPQFKEQKSVLKGLGPVKLPKPKAKDPNKRDMSVEEKQKLRMDLLSLPQDKMPQLVQKRNKQLAQDGDEIELDIEALDNETLWELDRFVTDWKKMVSKSKRQALMSNPLAVDIAPPASPSPSPIADAEKVAMSDKNDGDDDDGFGKKVRENEDEDVDIDDDMPAASFPPVEIEKDVGAGGVAGQDHDQNQEPGGGGDHNQGPVGGEGQAGPVYAPIVRRYRRLKIFKGGSPKPLRGLHLPDSSPSFDGDGPGPVDGHVDVSVEPTSDCKFKIAKGGYRKPLRGLVLPSLSPSRDRGRSGRKPKLAKEDSLEPLLFPGSPSFAGNLCLQKSVPIGHEHQVGAPPLVNDYKSNLVGTIIFPHEKGEKGEQEKGERGPIGEGRRGSCYCENPTSIECIKLHLSENNVGLQLDLGFAFEEWEFDKMPEFALEDWTKFGNLKKHSPPPPSGAKASKPAAVRYDRRSREKENAFTRKQWAVGCGDVRDVTSWANEAGAKKVTKATKAKAAAKNFVLYVDLKIDP